MVKIRQIQSDIQKTHPPSPSTSAALQNEPNFFLQEMRNVLKHMQYKKTDSNFFFCIHTFQMILRIKENPKNFFGIFFLWIYLFSFFLEFSETYPKKWSAMMCLVESKWSLMELWKIVHSLQNIVEYRLYIVAYMTNSLKVTYIVWLFPT